MKSSIVARVAVAALFLAAVTTFPSLLQAASGDVTWTNHFGIWSWQDETGAITTKGQTVFAAGSADDGSDNFDWDIRAYDSGTGALLWQTQFGNTNTLEDALAITTSGDRVFVAGIVDDGGTNKTDWLVVAFDATSGSPIWTNRYDLNNGWDQPSAVAAKGKRLFVVGQSDGGFTVRAYDARNGSLAWQDRLDPTSPLDQAYSVATDGANVYVAGWVVQDTTNYDWVVRAYLGANEKLLWEDRFDVAGSYDLPLAIDASGGRVVVVGYVDDGTGNEDWFVKAYNGKNGAELWHDRIDKVGGFDEATTVSLNGNAVYVAGISDLDGQNLGSGYHWIVRGYSARNGSLLWEDATRTIGGLTAPKALGVQGRSVFVGGTVYDAQNGSDWLVRAYDAPDGNFTWEDQYDNEGFYDECRGMTVGAKGVFMLGLVTDANTAITDWLVRGYGLR